MSQADSERPALHKLINVGLAVVLGMAVVGYFVGIRPAPSPRPPWMTPAAASASGSAIPGQTYWELRDRRVGPNAVTRSDLSKLRAALPSPTASVVQTPKQRKEALAAREARRAFDGAPPSVPHPIDEQATASCMACHERGMVVAGRLVPPVSHPAYANCTQCHAPSAPRFAEPEAVENGFAAYRPERKGERAWSGAPPSIPHPVFMRENCDSCHGVAGRPGIRTSHPDRGSCQQCHAQDTRMGPWVGVP